ncbi:hypothetical protein ACOMHN_050320 [Nucella lapillus]
MDHSSSQQDVEFQSIQNTMDEMIEKITKDQPENSVVKTQEKDTGKESENTSGGHVQEARIDDTDEGDPGNVDNDMVMSRDHGNRNPAATQILQNPEMTTRNNSSQMAVYFKEQTDIPSSNIEAGSTVLEELCSAEQMETNKVIQGVPDQMVPDQSYLVRDCQEKTYIQAEPDESLYGSEESKLKEMQLDVLGNIQPLLIGQCSRSLRIGLSRKQKVKRLHKNVN